MKGQSSKFAPRRKEYDHYKLHFRELTSQRLQIQSVDAGFTALAYVQSRDSKPINGFKRNASSKTLWETRINSYQVRRLQPLGGQFGETSALSVYWTDSGDEKAMRFILLTIHRFDA